MPKPFFEEYATHAYRFYAKNPVVRASEVKKSELENWEACDAALRRFSKEDRAVVLAVFGSKCSVPDAVKCISHELALSDNYIWQLLNRVTRAFAERRGLI